MDTIRVLSLFCIVKISYSSVDCVPCGTLGPRGTNTPSCTDFLEGDLRDVDFLEVLVPHF